MDDKKIQSILRDALEEEIPSSEISLWPDIHASLVAGKNNSAQQGERMNGTQLRSTQRVAFTILMIVALATVALITPQGRAFAQTILRFFTRAESNTFPLQPSQIPMEELDAPSTVEPPASLISIAEAELQANFDAAELASVPEGFEYLGARVYGNAIHLEYAVPGGGGNLIITQSKEGFIQSDWDKVPEEAIVPVKIAGSDGEFAEGTFVVPAGSTSATWNSDAPILRLRWVKDGIWFEMAKFGDVERIAYLDQPGMIALAESLTTNLFPLDLNEAESQVGFDVLEPATLPEGMTFLGASYDPILKMVSQSFGYSESDRRILINQQPVNSMEACDLCGLVGASASVEPVRIMGVPGEYALGVWNLTEKGPVWQDDPYLKTIRWQKNGIAYELIYMGMEVEKSVLLSVAESMK
jgi:hypothetical protein